ncbi:MAG: amino acid ABC transporter substrate-binding protein [Treponema sp.]|uniref:amino acid ABC transporter substrate-binding protein n=1 Tax=Treponema sp. TaxID=166 RepID=UPI0025D81C6D|nr:amino acid ABC transporter substrate-binding protein [Treponema sp.]MBQ8680839.1 amino acid ABC transporter substrate-binding protein [Treponema sp.]
MKLTKVLMGALASLLVMGLASCSKAANEFVLGLDDSFPPMGFRDDANEIVGYDIDLAKEVANRLGLKFRAQPISWSAKEQELNTGKIDCIWNGLSITPERLEVLAFTKPYLNNAQVVIVRADSGIKSLADMTGKILGVQAGSSAADAVDSVPSFKQSLKQIVDFSDNIMALNDLEIGGLDGVAMDSVVAEYSLKVTGKPFVILSDSLSPEQYGIAFKKDNTELRDKVQKALEEMAADGTVAKISEKWFGSDISIIGK